MTPPLRWRFLAAALAVLGTSGCSDTITSLEAETAGNYNLLFVEGEELPYPIGESAGSFITVVSGRVELRLDRTCQFNHTLQLRDPNTGVVTTNEDKQACTWSMNQTVLNLKFGDGPTAGYISGIAGIDMLLFDFTFDPFAVRFIYQRENAARPPL